ncbi:MAG: STAS domain-containing protein [Candidatus Melainabacteria bacterium]|nr:STAS domain-containing protein [Candidatus Melainabacteria bacterium]
MRVQRTPSLLSPTICIQHAPVNFPDDLPYRNQRKRLEIGPIEGNALIVTLQDAIIKDKQNIQIIGEQLFHIMDKYLPLIPLIPPSQDGVPSTGKRTLVLNFQEVDYMSSAIFGKFITLNKKAKDGGHKLILCNIIPNIYEVFEITSLNRLFTFEKDLDSAIAKANA